MLKIDVETFKPEFDMESPFLFNFLSLMFLPFFNLSQTSCPTFSINKFELGFDYSSVPEILCIVHNDFNDFAEEEIPAKLKNIFLKKKDVLGLMWIKIQIINIGIEEDPNLDRLNIETRGKI